MKGKKIKCYELDFGDTNLISKNPKDILDWIHTEVFDLEDGSENLNYEISIVMMTEQELDDLPEWS